MVMLPVILLFRNRFILVSLPQATRVFVTPLLLLSTCMVASAQEDGTLERQGTLRREGSYLSHVSGQVIRSGQRWSFSTSNDRSFRLLENLALERIVRSLKLDPTDRHWTVEGTFTEFRGENYLMLSGAIRATKPQSKQTAGADQVSASDPEPSL